MELFTRLNEKKKKTILLITHDAHVASYAQKTVHMKDWVFVKEEIN